MRRPPAPGSDGPEQRSLEDKQPEAFAENPTLSASSEQSPLCSGLFLSATEKQAIRPLPCSSSFAKSPARRACSVASALAMAYCRCQLFASYGSSIPISPKPKIPFSYLLGMYNDEKRPKGPDFAGIFVCSAAVRFVDSRKNRQRQLGSPKASARSSFLFVCSRSCKQGVLCCVTGTPCVRKMDSRSIPRQNYQKRTIVNPELYLL